MKVEGESSHLQTKGTDRVLRRNQLCIYFDFRFLASKLCDNKFPLIEPPNLWYFVAAAVEVIVGIYFSKFFPKIFPEFFQILYMYIYEYMHTCIYICMGPYITYITNIFECKYISIFIHLHILQLVILKPFRASYFP